MNRLFRTLLMVAGMLAASLAWAARSDLNGDGRSDILWYHSGVFGLISMNANGLSLAPLTIVGIQSGAQVVGVADLNGDGKADVVWRNKSTGDIIGQLMNGGNVLGQSTILTLANANQDVVAVTDIDGDGNADLVLSDTETGGLSVAYLNGLSVARTAAVEIAANPARRILAAGDLNGDGKKELLWRDDTNGALYAVFLSAPAGAANAAAGADVRFYFEPNLDWEVVGFDDFTGEGKTDVLWRNATTGDVYLMFMDGTSIAGGSFIYREPNQNWKIVATGDYDGDGKADIVWRNMASGDVYMMLMNGATIASQGFVYAERDMLWQIVGNVAPPPAFHNMVKAFGDPIFKLTPPASISDGAFTFEGSDSSVAQVLSTGDVKIVDVGSTKITVVQAATARFPEIRTTATLIVEKGTTKITLDPVNQQFQSQLTIPYGYSKSDVFPAQEEIVTPSATLSDAAFGNFLPVGFGLTKLSLAANKSGTTTLTLSLPERKRWKAATKSVPLTLAQVQADGDSPQLEYFLGRATDSSNAFNQDYYLFDKLTKTLTVSMCPTNANAGQTEQLYFAFQPSSVSPKSGSRLFVNGKEMPTEANPQGQVSFNFVTMGPAFIGTLSTSEIAAGNYTMKLTTAPYGSFYNAADSGIMYSFPDVTYTVVVKTLDAQTAKCSKSGSQ